MTTFHIYCDESCHGEKDRQSVMVLGSLQCPSSRTREVSVALRDLKTKHGLNPRFELKWTKISKAKEDYYLSVVDYFIENQDLAFRAVVVPDKSKLRHAAFGQTHDDFYYKLNYTMIQWWFERSDDYRIFMDIKDSRSAEKTRKLRDFLANSQYDYDRKIVKSIELVRSEQVEPIQIADLLIGAVGYANRGLHENAGKVSVIRRLRERTGLSLTQTTLLNEKKLNLLLWKPQEPAP